MCGRESGLMTGTSSVVRWDGRMWLFDTGGGFNMLRLQFYVAWAQNRGTFLSLNVVFFVVIMHVLYDRIVQGCELGCLPPCKVVEPQRQTENLISIVFCKPYTELLILACG
jgi:hypothetical protein